MIMMIKEVKMTNFDRFKGMTFEQVYNELVEAEKLKENYKGQEDVIRRLRQGIVKVEEKQGEYREEIAMLKNTLVKVRETIDDLVRFGVVLDVQKDAEKKTEEEKEGG